MLPVSIYSQLTPERSCPSPELNGMEATSLFQACGPKAWTRMDTGMFPCTGGTISIRAGVGLLTVPAPRHRNPGNQGVAAVPSTQPPTGVLDLGRPSHPSLSSHRNAHGQSCSHG